MAEVYAPEINSVEAKFWTQAAARYNTANARGAFAPLHPYFSGPAYRLPKHTPLLPLVPLHSAHTYVSAFSESTPRSPFATLLPPASFLTTPGGVTLSRALRGSEQVWTT
jgi:hypothetical protein